MGYEVQMASWGYLVERAAARGLNLPPLISRMPERERESRFVEMCQNQLKSDLSQERVTVLNILILRMTRHF